jgi:hypothetical protein
MVTSDSARTITLPRLSQETAVASLRLGTQENLEVEQVMAARLSGMVTNEHVFIAAGAH